MTIMSRGALLGSAPSEKSYLELLFTGNAERVNYLTGLYKADTEWYKPYGLTPALLKMVINKYADLSKNGKSIFTNAGTIVADIKRSSGVTLDQQRTANAIGTMDLAMQSFAHKEPNHSLVKWWRTGLGLSANVVATSAAATASATKSAATTVNNVVKTAAVNAKAAAVGITKGASELVADVVPWYLRPKTLVITAVAVGAAYILLPGIARGAASGIVSGARSRSTAKE